MSSNRAREEAPEPTDPALPEVRENARGDAAANDDGLTRGQRYYRANREKRLAKAKAWRAENLDKQRLYSARWRAANPEKARLSTRISLHKTRYGITLEEREEMLIRQGGRCASCRIDQATDLDHDHGTRVVRGLLCHACNVAEGLLKGDPIRIYRLLDYVKHHRKRVANDN